MRMPPEIKERLDLLNNAVVDIQIKHIEAARIEAQPIIDEISRIYEAYPAPMVIDLNQFRMPFMEENKNDTST